MKFEKYIIYILLVVITGLFFVVSSGYSYINELEQQVSERDSLIDKMAFSDALVKEYFDVRYDTITNHIVYTLKTFDQKPIEIAYKNGIEEFQVDNGILLSKEIVERYNILVGKYSRLVDDYNNLAKNYNKLIKDYNQLVDVANRQTDVKWYNEALKSALELIYQQYDIVCDIKKNEDSNAYVVSLPSFGKVDSALILFPYFKDNLIFNEDSGNWMIVKQKRIE